MSVLFSDTTDIAQQQDMSATNTPETTAAEYSISDNSADNKENVPDPGDVTERIREVDPNRSEQPSPRSHSSSSSVKNSPMPCQKESSMSPRSRIPVLVGKSPHPSESSRIPVRCSPSPKCRPASPKFVSVPTKPVQKRDFASNQPSKRYKGGETYTKLSSENASRLTKTDVGVSKLDQKFPKMDQAFLQRYETVKSKRNAKDSERGVAGMTWKTNLEARSTNQKSGKNLPSKKSAFEKMTAAKVKIGGEKVSDLKRQYPSEYEKFKNTMDRKQDCKMSTQPDALKEERADKQPVQRRRNTTKSTGPEKNVRRGQGGNRFPEISLEDLMKQADLPKKGFKPEILKNFQNELMKLKEFKSAADRGDGLYDEMEVEIERVDAGWYPGISFYCNF